MFHGDNAATTKTNRTATDAMLPYMDELCGNPSCPLGFGQKETLEDAGGRSAACRTASCMPTTRSAHRSGAVRDGEHRRRGSGAEGLL